MKLSIIHTAMLFLAPATVFAVFNMPQQAEIALVIGGSAVMSVAAWKQRKAKRKASAS